MAKIIGLPKLSPTMEEGTLVRWVKQEGEAVEVDDLVAEVETDKATMEFRSFDAGVLLKQLALEGATLAPDQPVAIIGKQGDDISELLSQAGVGAPEADKAKPAAKAVAKAAPPKPAAKAAETSQPRADGNGAEADEPDRETEEAAPERVQGRVFASPVVRKIAREKSIDLHGVEGTGPHGRVIKRDVENAEPGSARVGLPGTPMRGPSAPPPARRPVAQGQPAPASAAASGAPNTAPSAPVVAGEGDRVEKLSQMRKTIARRLSESKREVPHFYLTIDVDAEPLVELRARFNAELAASGEKLSLNDFIIKAIASALRRMPKVNVSFAGDSQIFHEHVNISVAVAVPDGLVTPVIRDADRLGVIAISQAVRDLASRAKAKKLKPEEMLGGTFSISNLGMYGIDEFSAVINPPEGAILAVGAVRDEPVVKHGAVVAGKKMALTMSCDHRVVDGALGAEWLRLLRSLLEAPLNMLL
ncbi:MAG: Dihydrolipoyllysine-residue acetyltransferase [Pseudomonadota bacterium]|jgi:pyruvate dehydrogenase E2 component (dihydrolipoamide acetyltransferase)